MENIIFSEKDFKHQFNEKSSLIVYYPKYREKYIKQVSQYIKKALENKKLSCIINYEERSIEISTNKQTRDPFIFIKGCEFIKIICKNIEVEIGMKVLEDDFCGEIIDLKRFSTNEKVLERRRDRLIGKNSMVLKAIKMVSKCHIIITGKNVGVVGSYEGVSMVKQIVVDCVKNNLHPVYQLKKLIVKNKLETDAEMKNEDWSQHVPEYKKKNQKKTKKHI